MTRMQKSVWKQRIGKVKFALEIITQCAVLGVLFFLVFVLMSLSGCASYPQMPTGDYGVEPVPEYVAVGPLPPHPEDGILVEVTIGELRNAIFVYEAYHVLLEVTNERGDLIEDLAKERQMILGITKEIKRTGQYNTVVGLGTGLLAGFVGGTVFLLVLRP